MVRCVFIRLPFCAVFIFPFILLLWNFSFICKLPLVSLSLTPGGRLWVVCLFGCLSVKGTWKPWMSFYTCIIWSPLPTMGILNVYPRIGSLGLFLGILHLFVTRNHDNFSSLELAGKPCPITFGVKSQGYCENGKFNPLVRSFVAFLNSSSNLCLYNLFSLLVLQFLIV